MFVIALLLTIGYLFLYILFSNKLVVVGSVISCK